MQKEIPQKQKDLAIAEVTKEIIASKGASELAQAGFSQTDLADFADQGRTSEIRIPAARLMHPTSDLVKTRKVTSGDIIRSTDNKVLGGEGKPLQVIPFKISYTWSEQKWDGKTMFRYDHERPHNDENMHDPFEYSLQGEKWKRYKTVNVYALLPDEVDPFVRPIVKFSFKSAAGKEGWKFSDHFGGLAGINPGRRLQGLPELYPASFIWEIGSKLVQSDSNSYLAYTVDKRAESKFSDVIRCATWYKTLKDFKGNVREDLVDDDNLSSGDKMSQPDLDNEKF